MAATVDFKARIVEAYNENEKLSQEAKGHSFLLGSDEHLDLITFFKPILHRSKTGLIEVNNLIETNFPHRDKEHAKELKMLLHMLHSSLTIFIDQLKHINFGVASLEEDRQQIIDETHQVEEYINDINSFVLIDNDDLLNEFI